MPRSLVRSSVARSPWRAAILGDTAVLIGLAFALVVLHTLTNGQYGFHRDELDTLDNAQRLAWGYVAYPPLTPFMGRLALTLCGPALAGIRLPAALAMGAVLILTGLMARDLGGRRPAQVVAALAVAISPVVMTGGVMLHYLAFDYLWWVLAAYCVIRLLRTDDPRWWLGIGTAIGLGMMTKYGDYPFREDRPFREDLPRNEETHRDGAGWRVVMAPGSLRYRNTPSSQKSHLTQTGTGLPAPHPPASRHSALACVPSSPGPRR